MVLVYRFAVGMDRGLNPKEAYNKFSRALVKLSEWYMKIGNVLCIVVPAQVDGGAA